MHNHQDEEAYEGYPNFSRLPKEGDVQSLQTQTDIKLSELTGCFAFLIQHEHLSNMGMEEHITKDIATAKACKQWSSRRNKAKGQ